MALIGYLKIFLALIFVLSLIVLLSFLMRKLDTLKNKVRNSQENRLGILENLYLGKGERMVLMRKDQVEYLILVTNNSSIIIDKYLDINSDDGKN